MDSQVQPMTSITGRRKHNKPQQIADNRGVTLIELILVLAILCILAAIITPRLSGFAEGRKYVAEWNRLLGMVRYARSEAIARAVPVEINFDKEQGTYGIVDDGGLKNVPVEYATHTLPEKLSFEFPETETREDNRIAIRFLPDGSLDEGSPKQFQLIEQEGNFTRTLAQDPLLGYVSAKEESDDRF